MTDDLPVELKAMAQLESALKELGDEERGRVLLWANARFKSSLKNAGTKVGTIGEANGGDQAEQPDLATFYASAGPISDADKALVVAYWLQYRENVSDVEAQTVNTRLKHLGYGVGNITRAFETLKDEKPALIVQTKKTGSTQQARKKFKVTSEGKKKVEGMLRPEE